MLSICVFWAFSHPSIFADDGFVRDAVSNTKGPILGEKLTYILRWGLIPVGWATLHVESIQEYQGRKVYLIEMNAWSNSFLSAFYRVRDHAKTWVDVEGLFSWRFYKKQYEGGYQSEEVMEYDQDKNHAVYRSLKNGTMKEMDIPHGVQDALSGIYFFRTMPLKVGESQWMDVNADEKNWKLEIQVQKFRRGWEFRKFGTLDAFLVEPLAQFKGMFEKRGRVWVWITSDRRRLPIQVKSKVPFGSVTATLVKAEIIKNNDRKEL